MRLSDMRAGERGRLLAVDSSALPFTVAPSEGVVVVNQTSEKTVIEVRGVRLSLPHEVAERIVAVRVCR